MKDKLLITLLLAWMLCADGLMDIRMTLFVVVGVVVIGAVGVSEMITEMSMTQKHKNRHPEVRTPNGGKENPLSQV